jgi:hypothetical protein
LTIKSSHSRQFGSFWLILEQKMAKKWLYTEGSFFLHF